MLSTLTIISVFIEIFTAGILVSSGLAFFNNYYKERRAKDLYLGAVFMAIFAYVAATLTSQLMFNLGRPLAELIAVQKWVSISLLASAFFIWPLIVEKFKIKFGHLFSAVWLLVVGFLIVQVAGSAINLVYREGIIEPIVNYSSALITIKPLLALMWLVLFIVAVRAAFSSNEGKKTLFFFTGASALLLLAGLFCGFLYGRFGEAGYLLASWIIFLLGILGLLLGDLVPPETPEARQPLRFLRTRILFKLVLIFVLTIVVLFETTTLATISISKDALSKTIQQSYFDIAQELAGKIGLLGKNPKYDELNQLVEKTRGGKEGKIFVVDKNGRLVFHPDKSRVMENENLIANEAVRRILSGDKGAGEFRDEIGGVKVGAYVPTKDSGLGVIIEEPMATAYFEIRRLETNSLLFVMAGLLVAVLAGVFFAHSIEKPIKELTLGTEAVARGELGYRLPVSSADEIGRLAEAFNRMTKDLRDSQERLILSEKLASLGTMAAGMAHEIKNPLVSLRTFTQLLTQKWDDKEFREKFSAIIPHEIERINRIAESLLKFGRPMKPELTKVEINPLLEEVLLLFESECKKNNVRVTKKLAELPKISGDAGQLSQAFVNIIKNAIESMQKSGGELTVKTDIGEVVKLGKMQRQGTLKGEEMTWGEEEEEQKPIPVVFIEISDTGEGISEENLKSLFDPFFTTKMSGTGMGLPITLRIVEEHKGSIKVRSKLGRGTAFIITLPQQV